MRVGVIGCGYWGSKHVRALSSLPEVESVVAVDPDPSRREAMTSRYADRGYESLGPALSSVDAVVVAVAPGLHHRIALQAIEAGKHVLVEKPLATSTEDAQELVTKAAAAGVVLMVGHTFEFSPAIHELKARITRGDLGEVQYLDAAWLNLGLYQADVNVLWDLAPHAISVSNYLLDSRPTKVGAWGSRHGNGGVSEDVAMLQLHYEEPAVNAYIRVSWLDPAKVRRVTVVGTKRMAVFNDLAHAEPLRIYDRGVDSDSGSDYGPSTLTYRYGEIVSPYVPPSEPLTAELKHFIECIWTGEKPRSDGSSGLAVVSTLEVADKAMASGRILEVPPPVPVERRQRLELHTNVPEELAG